MPHIPTAPLHHGCAASHSTASYPSSVSVGGVLVEGDAAGRARAADVDPAQGVAALRRASVPRRDVRVRAASCPCRTGSSRGSPGTAPRARRGRTGSHRLADSSTPSRAGIRTSQTVSTSWRGGLAGRRRLVGGGHRPESTGRAGTPDAARPRRATMARDGRARPRRRTARGPGARGASPTRTRGSRSGTTRSPGRTASPASTASSTSRTSRPASSSSTTTTASCSSASIATRSTSTSWEIPEGGVPAGETALEGARRELREETGVTAADWRELARVPPLQLGLRRARGPLRRDRPDPRRGDARRDRGARGPLAAVRRGARDDPRRPDHRRDDVIAVERLRAPSRVRRATTGRAERGRSGSTRRDWDAIVVGLGGIGSGAAYWLSRSLGDGVLGLEQFELGPRQRRLGRPQPDHPAVLPPARLRAAGQARLRDVGRGRGATPGERIVTITGGLDLWPADRGHPAWPTTRQPDRRGRPVRAARRAPRSRRRWPQWRLGDDVTRDVPGPGRPGRPVPRQRRPPAARRGRRRDAARPHAGRPAIRDAGGGDSRSRRPDATYRTGRVVLAADAWTNELLASFGRRLPLTVTKEQVTYFACPDPAAFAPDRFPVWIWMDEPSFYGFPTYGEAGPEGRPGLRRRAGRPGRRGRSTATRPPSRGSTASSPTTCPGPSGRRSTRRPACTR